MSEMEIMLIFVKSQRPQVQNNKRYVLHTRAHCRNFVLATLEELFKLFHDADELDKEDDRLGVSSDFRLSIFYKTVYLL